MKAAWLEILHGLEPFFGLLLGRLPVLDPAPTINSQNRTYAIGEAEKSL